jgi:hypothetical protein
MPDKVATTSTTELVSSTIRDHTTPLTERTEAITTASKSLATQERTLIQDTQKLSRQAEKLEAIIGKRVDQLKELGDLQNWAEVVFRDMTIIEETLSMVEEEELERHQNGNHTDARTS